MEQQKETPMTTNSVESQSQHQVDHHHTVETGWDGEYLMQIDAMERRKRRLRIAQRTAAAAVSCAAARVACVR